MCVHRHGLLYGWLETYPGFSERALSAIKHWAISPAQGFYFWLLLASLLSLHRSCYIFYDILKNQISIKHLRRRLFRRPRNYEQGRWWGELNRLKGEAAMWQELDDWMRARLDRQLETLKPQHCQLYTRGPFKVLVSPQVMWLGYEN